MRDCGVCRARRSRGGLFPLAYSPSKAIGRNSQKSGIPTEILKISVFGLSCVRAIVYASVIRSAPQKSPPPFLDFTTPVTTPFFRGPLALYGNSKRNKLSKAFHAAGAPGWAGSRAPRRARWTGPAPRAPDAGRTTRARERVLYLRSILKIQMLGKMPQARVLT